LGYLHDARVTVAGHSCQRAGSGRIDAPVWSAIIPVLIGAGPSQDYCQLPLES
jgi:hypothetical protein